ncbi:MAG: response regulator [Nitrospinota bacterium]
MKPKKVLLVDDEVEFCKLLKDFLECEGYLVDVAHDAEEGLAKAIQFEPELVLLDIRMPNKDGFYFMDNIKGLNAVQIIIITAIQDSSIMERCSQLGIRHFIFKPIDLMETKAIIEDTLRRDSLIPT